LRAAAAAPALAPLLRSEVADVRRAVAGALADVGAIEAAPALRDLASDPDVEVRKTAARALEALAHPARS